MISWKSLILCWNSSRVGNAISDSSLIGVPSCFSGGRRIVKCTRSTLASDFKRLRQVRSPECDHRAVVDRGQLVLERGRLDLDDVRPGVLDIDVDADGLTTQHRALVDRFAVAAHRDLGALAADALIVEPG